MTVIFVRVCLLACVWVGGNVFVSVEEIEVMENSRSRMWCNVPFDLPNEIEVIWRFAEEVKTQQMEQFKEVTAGVDRVYSIPSTSLQHQGTYQCEIYSDLRSIVRLYFYIAGNKRHRFWKHR